MLRPHPKPKTLLNFVLGVVVALGLAVSAHADTMTFNFNSLADGNNNASIQSYMQGVLGSLGTVTVTGAVAEQNYNGDGHVVGGTFSGNYYSNTLGTSDGATGPLNGQRTPGSQNYYDTFIVNNTSLASGTDTDRVTMTFTLPVGSNIVSVSFDYEIFPNANCQSLSNCNSVPDFTLKVDGAQKLYKAAGAPASGSGNNSPCNYPSCSSQNSSETAWQFIGFSGLININDSNNVTTFEFIDWPTMIGLDNLVIDYALPLRTPLTSKVPEPSSMLLLGLGLIGLRLLMSSRGRKEEK